MVPALHDGGEGVVGLLVEAVLKIAGLNLVQPVGDIGVNSPQPTDDFGSLLRAHRARGDQYRGLDRLDAALAALDEDKRAVFVLFEIEELSMQEVASAVDCPLQTAYARLYAGRKQIEAAFRRDGLAGRTA